ncbi:MAG: ComEC/Rec2 family competence protein [Cyclobacteriaceae bacterium]
MKFNEFPFLRYTVFFLLGVLFYPLAGIWLKENVYILLSILFCCYLILVIKNSFRKYPGFKLWIPLLAYANLIVAGLVFISLHDLTRQETHLLNIREVDGYMAEVTGVDVAKPNSIGNSVEVMAIQVEDELLPAIGKVMIYHRSKIPLEPGMVILVKGEPQRIAGPKNPSEFDYAAFMGTKQVYFSHFIGERLQIVPRRGEKSWQHKVLDLRARLESKIESFIPEPGAAQIAKALLLGQKEELEREISEAYITAGAMHVLAVSGLHVGIIYGFFFLIWKPMRLKGMKRVGFLAMVVLVIWFYALITGMSPSVLRAATMFTLMAMAQMKSRNPSIFNPLALSAMVLVMFDPYIVFSVGFQLSYTALTGILLFQPLISRMWIPSHKWIQYFWEITAVGLAAQLATFPLSIHFFHVFPTYFIFSNLIAIPGAFLVMATGIPFLIFSSFEAMAVLMGQLVNFLVRCLNQAVFSLQHLPFSRMENLYFHLTEMVFIWALLLAIYFYFEDRKRQQLLVILITVVLLGFYRIGLKTADLNKDELMVYKIGKGVAVDYIYKGQWYSYLKNVSEEDFRYHVLPHKIKNQGVESRTLYAKSDGPNFEIFLPGQGKVGLFQDSLYLDPDQEHEIYAFEGGNWIPINKIPAKGLVETAFKVKFNKRRSSF